LEVPANVVRGLLGQPAKRLFSPTERTLAVVEVVQPGHDPARPLLDAAAPQLRMSIEQTVVDEGAKEDLRGVMDPEEVLGADVLAPTEMVGDGHVIVVERWIKQSSATA